MVEMTTITVVSRNHTLGHIQNNQLKKKKKKMWIWEDSLVEAAVIRQRRQLLYHMRTHKLLISCSTIKTPPASGPLET